MQSLRRQFFYSSEPIPAILDIHSTVHTVIVHSGTNDVMSRKSSKLHYELESLISTVEHSQFDQELRTL